jgi:hydrogenase maturation protease
MGDLRRALATTLVGRTCVVGVGNVDLSDDGVGPRVVADLAEAGFDDAIVAGTTPERWMERLASGDYDDVLFVDALAFDAQPGAVALLAGSEIRSRLPQVSTHKISLGTLADLIARRAPTRVHLLGVRPATLRAAGTLSAPVRETAEALTAILRGVLASARDLGQRRRDPEPERSGRAVPAAGECLSR